MQINAKIWSKKEQKVLSYNKDHDTSSLKKHKVYRRWGVFML